jgi:hypothetical protein
MKRGLGGAPPKKRAGGVRGARGGCALFLFFFEKNLEPPLALNLRILHSSLCTFEYSGDKYPTLRVAHYYNTFLSLIFFEKKETYLNAGLKAPRGEKAVRERGRGGPFSFLLWVGLHPAPWRAPSLLEPGKKKSKKRPMGTPPPNYPLSSSMRGVIFEGGGGSPRVVRKGRPPAKRPCCLRSMHNFVRRFFCSAQIQVKAGLPYPPQPPSLSPPWSAC